MRQLLLSIFMTSLLFTSQVFAQQDSSATSITTGGYLRWSEEWFQDPNFGRATDESQGYFLQRYLMHVEVKDTDTNIRGFIQAKYSEIANKVGNHLSTDRDDGDIHQAFFESKHLRAGRQESPVGSTLLVGVREGPNSRLSFDGLKGFLPISKSTEIFIGHPVDITSGFVDNRSSDTILGYAYFNDVFQTDSSTVDLYVMYYDDLQSQLYTPSVRWIYKTDFITIDTDFMLQGGRFNDSQDVWAYGIASRVKKPLVATLDATLVASYISGDKDPNDSQHGTFNALFPKGQYYGWSGEMGHPNLIALVPGITWYVTEAVAWSNNVGLYWRESIHDGLYRGSGSLLRASTNDERFIATQINSSAEWKINKLFSLYYEYTYTFAGDFIRASNDSQDSQYFALRTALRF